MQSELDAVVPEGAYAADPTAAPTLEDFKRMVLLEAAGQAFYQALAATAPNDDVRRLLGRNGQEEMAHAHRVRRVIERLHGEEVAVPAAADNPFVRIPADLAVTRALLDMIVTEELKGEQLYENWAAHLEDGEAAELLRLNGREERRHAERAQEVMALMGI